MSIVTIDYSTGRIKFWDIQGREYSAGVCKIEGCRDQIEFNSKVCAKCSTTGKEY